MASNGRMILNDELERKENIMVYFAVLSQHFPGGNEENHETSVKIADIWHLRNTKQDLIKF
jgi:hypothetical protein